MNKFIIIALYVVAHSAHADGALDPGWGSPGQYPAGGRSTVAFNLGGSNSDQAFGTALQGDGKLIIVGSAATGASSGVRDVAVTRLLADGTLDTQFATAGRFTYNFSFPGLCDNDDRAAAVAIDTLGRIIVVGTAACNPNAVDPNKNTAFVMRLLADGTLDPNFGNGGVMLRFNDTHSYGATAVALYLNTILIAAYDDYPAFGTSNPYFEVYDSAGDSVTVYPWGSVDNGSRPTGISVDAAGNVTLSGYYQFAASGTGHTYGFDCFVSRIAFHPATGYAADSTFGNAGTAVVGKDLGGDNNDRCYGHAIASQGDIWLVGDSTDANNGKTATVFRVAADGSSAAGTNFYFFSAPVPVLNSLRAVAIDSQDRIVAAGYGQTSDTRYAPFNFVAARLFSDFAPDVSFQDGGPLSDDGQVSVGFETGSSGSDDGAFAMALDRANRVYVVGQHQISGSNYDIAAARLQSDAIFIDGLGDTDL